MRSFLSSTHESKAGPNAPPLIRKLYEEETAWPAWRMTASYVTALVLVAGFTLGAHLLVERALADQQTDATVVNLAGRQRMLGERVAREGMAIVAFSRQNDASLVHDGAELRAALVALRAGHQALVSGDDSLGVPPTSQASALQRLRQIAPPLDRLVAAAESLLVGGNPDADLSAMLAAQVSLLSAQEALVAEYARLARSKVSTLSMNHQRILWATLLLLVLVAALVCEPAARAMRSQLQVLREAGRRLGHQVHHDSLTGLPNRAALLPHLGWLLRPPAGVLREPVAVYFLDFDRFKAINDSLGHAAGDALLKEIAARALNLRPGAGRLEVFRLGGDEFVLLLHGAGIQKHVEPLAEAALREFAKPYRIDGHLCVSTVSIGIATAFDGDCPSVRGERSSDGLSESVPSALAILRNADLAMMHSKAMGKARSSTFDQEMETVSRHRFELQENLRIALADEALDMRYLPLIDAETGELLAAEALLFWDRGEGEEIRNCELIELAEESGLIHDLGDLAFASVRNDVDAYLRNSPGAKLPVIHLNISRAEATRPNFLDRVTDLLDACPALRGNLCLEFREACLGRGILTFSRLLERVKALGVETCVDRFGGSQSSLADLASLKIDHIKLDLRSFSFAGMVRAQALMVPRALVALARSLNMTVTLSGIDSRHAVATALDFGVDAMEGVQWGEAASLETLIGRFDTTHGHQKAA